MSVVRKAVFPVAGLGTRFLPATKASPKEMLCVVDKPLIQYAVEEAVEAGITEMIFVTGRSKRSIEDHFDRSFELEHELEAKQKTELLSLVRNIKPAHVNCVYVRQPEALGLGHAVNCAASLVGNEPFAVVLGRRFAGPSTRRAQTVGGHVRALPFFGDCRGENRSPHKASRMAWWRALLQVNA